MMISEIMQEILAAERQAEEISEQANAEAKEIVTAAEAKRAEIIAAGKKSAADILRSLENETDRVAAEEEARVIEKGKKDARALEAAASEKVALAASEIAKKLFEEYGVTTL